MSRRPPQVVSRIDLPSGKVLEVVQPDSGAPYTRLEAAVVTLAFDARVVGGTAAPTPEALEIQKRLLAEAQAAGQPDGYIFEEMGECLIALHRPAEARPYFAVAYEMLSKDPWLTRDEPERLERIRKFAGQ